MGCFLTCFGGVSNRKKRRKQPQRFLLRDRIHGSYQPLDSFVQEPSTTSLISSNKVTAKIKKKVRFDLNVRTYEPILQDEQLDEPASAESCSNTEDTGEETSRVDLSSSDCDTAFPPGRTLPLNNRYQNCRDSYFEEEEEEDDEFVFADSDFDYESDEDLDSFDEYDDTSIGEEDSLSSKSEEEAPLIPLVRNGQKTHSSSSNEDARPRGRFAESVLNPVENLTQWKAIKAKEAAPPKCRFKENIALENKSQLKITTPDDLELKSQCSNKSLGKREIKVNLSLSNWLPMSDTTTDDDDDPCKNLKPLLIKNALTRQGVSC